MTPPSDESARRPATTAAATVAAAVEWSRWAGWPLSPGIESALTRADEEPCSPGDPDAPEIVFALARTGNRRAGLDLARALAAEPLSLAPGDLCRTADVVICRLWSARVELRDDPAARETADRLVGAGGLDPVRRALLHYGLGATILEGPVDALGAALETAGDHFHLTLTLARTLGMHELAAAALSRLAIVELPSTHLSIIERLSSDALAVELPRRGTPARWQVRAAIIQQWSRHLQGQRLDPAVLEVALGSPGSVDRLLLPYCGALAAVAALEAGDVRRARRLVDQANADRRLRGLGTWRLPLIMLDGYLAVISSDAARVRSLVNELTALLAPAESLVLRAVHLAGLGELRAALSALRPVTSTSVRATPVTFSTACALEAVLHSRLGDDAAAAASMRQTLGATEPMSALRIFTLHSVPTTVKVLDQVLSAGAEGWATEVRRHLDRFADSAVSVLTTPVGREAPTPDVEAAGDAIPTLTGSPLTNRERQVLILVNDGASQAAMARELYVSLNTIKTHLRSIRQKLGVDRTGEAAAMARSAGWLDPPRVDGERPGVDDRPIRDH